MPLTKSFDDLVQNRAANDPEFAAALRRETTATPPLTIREALRQIWKAASYPMGGNEDWRIAARMDTEALSGQGMRCRTQRSAGIRDVDRGSSRPADSGHRTRRHHVGGLRSVRPRQKLRCRRSFSVGWRRREGRARL
jgi:hypothetical protein